MLKINSLVTQDMYNEFLELNNLNDTCTNQEFTNLSEIAEGYVREIGKESVADCENFKVAICLFIYNYAENFNGEQDENQCFGIAERYLRKYGMLKSQL